MENDFSINPYQQPVCVIIDGDLLTSGRYFLWYFKSFRELVCGSSSYSFV
jgi:hypothetical protein